MYAFEYKTLCSDMFFSVVVWHKLTCLISQLTAFSFFPNTLYAFEQRGRASVVRLEYHQL